MNKLYKQLIDLADERPDKIFVSDTVTKYTRSSFLKAVNLKSEQMLKEELKPGTAVGLSANNCLESLITLFAMWELGTVPAMFNARWTDSEMRAAAENFGINRIIKFDDYYGLSVSFLNFEFNGETERLNSSGNLGGDETSVIIFTSGSTGTPKAVEISFSNLFNNYSAVKELADINENDMWLASLPFYHIGGFAIIARSLFAGTTLNLSSTLKPDKIIEAVNRLQPNLISLVPQMMISILKDSPEALKSFKAVFLGGGPVPDELIDRAINKNLPVFKVYGSTETTSMIAAADTFELSDNFETTGKALAGTEIKIVDSNWNELNRNEIGLIAVKGEIIAEGYFRNEIEWQKRIKDGFFLTGDYGRIDGFGFLYVEMRREDLIVSGGENVNPREVEAVIKSVSGISGAYVFGIPDDKWGEAVSALIESDNEIDFHLLKEILKEKLADYKIPKKAAVIPELPKTAIGKIDKQKATKYIELNGTTL